MLNNITSSINSKEFNGEIHSTNLHHAHHQHQNQLQQHSAALQLTAMNSSSVLYKY
jgi:hypothetical protein